MTPVLFDTSIWVKLVKDRVPFENWDCLDIVPFLPLEIVYELLNVDDSNRLRRLEYLSTIPRIAVISVECEYRFCSVFDLISLEYLHEISKQTNSLQDFVIQKLKIISGEDLCFLKNMNNWKFLENSQRKNTILSNPMLSSPQLWKCRLSDVSIHQVFDESRLSDLNELLESRPYKKKKENEKSYCKDFFIDFAKGCVHQGVFELIKKIGMSVDPNMLLSDFSRMFFLAKILPDIASNINASIEMLKTIDFRKMTTLSILDAFKEEYCKEMYRDKRRSIESSSYIDGQLVVYSYFLPVMVDSRTIKIVKVVNHRNFGLKCFTASNVSDFIDKLKNIKEKLSKSCFNDVKQSEDLFSI